MNHPTSAELLDYQKRELPPEQALVVEEHLKTCDECREEWDVLERLDKQLSAWPDNVVQESFVEATMNIIEYEQSTARGEVNGGYKAGLSRRSWFRRAALAGGAIAASLLFQAIIWNPLAVPITFRAIFNLTPAAVALTTGQAVPDTILVLTLHSDETLSASTFEGTFTVEDLVQELSSTIEKGRFESVLLIGSDPGNPVTFRLDKLQSLFDELEINTLTVGEGVVGLEVDEDITARINVPIEIRSIPRINVRLDSLPDALVITPMVLEIAPQRFKIIRIKPFVRIEWPFIRLSVLGDSLRTIVMADTSGTMVTGVVSRSSILEDLEEAMLDSLVSSCRAVLTVTSNGIVLMNRAAVPLEEIEEALMRLRVHNGEISLLILIPEGSGPDDPGYNIVDIANRIGIKGIIIKKVKHP